MAKFRYVYTTFWNDPRVVEEMTAEDKYFFLYLLTNESTTQIGIYQITKKQIAFDMGYSMESVGALLQRFRDHHKLIKYNEETREIAIKNWGKYNLNRGGKPILDCVKSELKEVKDTSLIQWVGEGVSNDSVRNVYESYYDTSHDSYNVTQENEESSNDAGSYDTSTIRGQKEKEEEKEEENKKEKQTTDSEVGQSLVTEEQLIFLTKFYDENIQRVSGYICECIEHMTKENDPALVYEAMKITALQQPNKPMQYTERILANWRKDYITNVKQLKAKEEREKIKRQQSYQFSYQRPKGRTEVVPEWFANRNEGEEVTPASESNNNTIYFEAERQKVLKMLGKKESVING
ncbi:DnaD domain protein [Lysinibacillus xylanilyticus]|uniref:DnaD domain protein n=1 Tax=Lysinibacillus xylanilyticus TaxID=582475 RepID=UPI0036DED7B4